MRILKIAGQNIASLADAFVIDLTAEPLRSAGLFAITGQTGAGKSSILDALCLALYGDAPRLASGSRQDEVPDAGGEVIKAQDPRAMLRRGAVHGWAAVTFTGIDGQIYEAKWSARRARDRADGRLQGVSRQIARVADGQVLASQLSHVSDQVQALTGLSYDEFRRTVLLAQGDFDAFLRAETNERAALLEKVTGTGLYRAISTAVFDRTALAQSALTLLTQQRDAHHLLSDEARAALEGERHTLTTTIDAGRAERLQVGADLARHQRRSEAQARLHDATQTLANTHQQADAATPDRDHLATLDRAEPLRLPYEGLRQAQSTETRASGDLALAAAALTTAQTAATARHAAAQSAATAHEVTEAAFKALGPLWTAATQLDSRLKDAADEAARSKSEALAAGKTAQTAETLLAQVQQQTDTTAAALTTAQTDLTRLARLAPLALNWTSIARDLADRATAAQTRRQALTDAQTLAVQATATDDQLATLDATDSADHSARHALTAQATALADQITALDATAPQTRLADLTRLATALTALDRIHHRHATAQTALTDATTLKSSATADRDAAEIAIRTAETALTRAETTALALTAPAEQAGLAASDAARTLRLHLQPGQPCPVCGAADHPNHADAALSDLASRLRADLARAQSGAATARNQWASATGSLAGAMTRAAQADTAIAAHSATLSAATADWTTALPFAPDLGPLPAPVTDALHQTETARQSALATLSTLATLRADKDGTDTRRTTLTAAIDSRADSRRTLTAEQAQRAQHAALAAQTAADAGRRMASLDLGLAPHLTAANEPATALDDPALPARLHVAVQHFTQAQTRLTTLQTDLASLLPSLATAQAGAAQTARHASTAATAATARATTSAALAAERAPLLDGEPTEAHRTRHNAARLASQTAKDDATSTAATAKAALGLASGHHSAAVQTRSQASAATTAATATLSAALSATDLTHAALTVLFAQPRAQTDALRHRLRLLEDAVTAATAAVTARALDLTQAVAAGIPDQSADALTEALTALDAAQSTRQERIGALNTELATDLATRTTLTGLHSQIATAQDTADVWRAVNDAIGSRNGDAFARIAQSITLDQLVDHANHHLADLKPRYRLQRAGGLALQVLDMDMGAEARATRSLSGGERFLVSLALALALSRMGDKGGLAATLFIDEGFGSLDAETLDVAIDALETLQAQGRTIGVISHVEAMKDRIPVQIRVQRQGGGKSTVTISGPAMS